ncbi:hypothetical protein PYCCODRAFT_439739 [Trametes coccinea BRFM310]|uniref:Secreted protein n=1 Tax=Trametes coccinea (strain BRFM310) TaxID=1353009 RepID=A0A1Y2ILV2_TRAC3|nr:hypothetical protein PYCCODRAFT_439739 [Trametes coccinea BRFM310]
MLFAIFCTTRVLPHGQAFIFACIVAVSSGECVRFGLVDPGSAPYAKSESVPETGKRPNVARLCGLFGPTKHGGFCENCGAPANMFLQISPRLRVSSSPLLSLSSSSSSRLYLCMFS